MTDFTPARLAELRAVAEAATEPDHYVCDCYVQCGDEVCPNPKPIYRSIDNEAVLSLIAALSAKTAEVEGYKQHFPCDRGCNYNDGPQEECSLHGRNPRDLWEVIGGLARERDEARAEVERLGDVEKMLAESEHANETYAGIEGELMELKQTLTELAPSAAIVLTEEVVVDGDVFTWGDLPDVLSRTRETLAEARREAKGQYLKRREARAAVEALDREVWRMRALRTEASADRTLEMVEQQRDKADRRADRAEAAIERAREAATEVTNQGDNNGRTHYEKCWTQHLHCLAAKIIYETGADDDTQP